MATIIPILFLIVCVLPGTPIIIYRIKYSLNGEFKKYKTVNKIYEIHMQ